MRATKRLTAHFSQLAHLVKTGSFQDGPDPWIIPLVLFSPFSVSTGVIIRFLLLLLLLSLSSFHATDKFKVNMEFKVSQQNGEKRTKVHFG